MVHQAERPFELQFAFRQARINKRKTAAPFGAAVSLFRKGRG